MEKYFTISKAAKLANVTAETLRHYDRIGLIKPSKIDEWTNYRYYTDKDIVTLNTIHALRCMDMPLNEIKDILSYTNFDKIVKLLYEYEHKADIKMEELKNAKSKIRSARNFYESKIDEKQQSEIFILKLKERVILLSESMDEPSLENLWDYHKSFYKQLGDALKDKFSFEDIAGIYNSQNKSRLFAVCKEHIKIDGLKILPSVKYLCLNCTENNRSQSLEKLINVAKNQYNITPQFTVQLVVLTGILKWNYQLQILLDS